MYRLPLKRPNRTWLVRLGKKGGKIGLFIYRPSKQSLIQPSSSGRLGIKDFPLPLPRGRMKKPKLFTWSFRASGKMSRRYLRGLFLSLPQGTPFVKSKTRGREGKSLCDWKKEEVWDSALLVLPKIRICLDVKLVVTVRYHPFKFLNVFSWTYAERELKTQYIPTS